MKLALLAAAALAVAAPAFAATTTFVDADMALSGYNFTTYTSGPGYTTETNQAVGNGGGTSFEALYAKVGQTTLTPRFQGLSKTFIYDPSTQGAITTIDTSIDHFLAITSNGAPVTGIVNLPVRLLAQQDGKLYDTFRIPSTVYTFSGWTSVSFTGLTAADFLLFNPLAPYANRVLTGLDFAGSAITFGFEVLPTGVLTNGGPSTGSIRSAHRLDNFSVTVNSVGVTAVPEPATWAMLISGFALAGAALRRRRGLVTAQG